jgi:hypothetical protein
MVAYIRQHLGVDEDEATRIRQDYWQRYGATLLGLMRHHAIDPQHFLWHTHQFPDLKRMLVFERALKAMLRRLPGRKIVFSNAPLAYSEAVLELTGVRRLVRRALLGRAPSLPAEAGSRAFRHLLAQRATVAAALHHGRGFARQPEDGETSGDENCLDQLRHPPAAVAGPAPAVGARVAAALAAPAVAAVRLAVVAPRARKLFAGGRGGAP